MVTYIQCELSVAIAYSILGMSGTIVQMFGGFLCLCIMMFI